MPVSLRRRRRALPKADAGVSTVTRSYKHTHTEKFIRTPVRDGTRNRDRAASLGEGLENRCAANY
jgi:hypothetical protein